MVQLWDFLVWLTVIFPLLTGGIWIRRPGLFIELSQINGPVIVLALLGWLIWLRRPDPSENPLDRASSVRVARAAWASWMRAVDRAPIAALSGTATIFGLLFSFAALRRHWAYGSAAYDLGLFANGLWNLTQGNGYFSSPRGLPLLADHQTWIHFLIAPLFDLAPHAETLLIMQAFALAFGGVALFFLARQYLDSIEKSKEKLNQTERLWVPYALPWVYWAYAPMRHANSFDYHPETLMLPLFLAGITCVQSRSTGARIAGLIALLLACATKETAGAVACAIGIAWLLGAGPEATRAFTRRLGAAIAAFGAAFFFYDVFIVPKRFGEGHVYMGQNLAIYGGSIKDLLLSPVLKPGVFWSQILGPARIKFLWMTIAPLALLPLLAWRPLLVALPGYLLLFLIGGDHRLSIQYHYAIEPAVGLFWASAVALATTATTVGTAMTPAIGLRARWLQPGVLLLFTLAFFDRSEMYRIRRSAPTEHQKWLTSELIPAIRRVPISATTALVPHLFDRFWIREIPILEQGGGVPVDCAVFDTDLNNWSLFVDPSMNWEIFRAKLRALSFHEAYHCGSTEVWQREGAAGCLVREPPCPH